MADPNANAATLSCYYNDKYIRTTQSIVIYPLQNLVPPFVNAPCWLKGALRKVYPGNIL